MESFDFPKGETVGPTMPKSHSTYLMSSFMSHKPTSGSRGEEGKDPTSHIAKYDKFRRPAYNPVSMYKKPVYDHLSRASYDSASKKRGKSTLISHSSAYYHKKTKR